MKCPECSNDTFLKGPRGGLSINIKCARCGTEYNRTPLDLEKIGQSVVTEAERLSLTDKGG